MQLMRFPQILILVFASTQIWIAISLADIIRVPGDAPTIQQGLDLVSQSDTVLVSLGTYSEVVTAPALPFALIGDAPLDTGDFPRPVIDASLHENPAQEYALTLVPGSIATIERIRFGNHVDDYGVRLDADSAWFRDCAFDSLASGIYRDQHDPAAMIGLERCTFMDYFSGPVLSRSAVRAHDCLFSNIGVFEVLCGPNSVIENCEFRNAPLTAITGVRGPLDIRNCVFGPCDSMTGGVYLDLYRFSGSFEHNLFTTLTLGAAALYVNADGQNQALITDNVFYNCVRPMVGPMASLLYIYCDTMQTQPYFVERNEMFACSTGGDSKGINAHDLGFFAQNRLHDLLNPYFPAIVAENTHSIVFRENIFYHNGRAMNVEHSELVDARWNYWGDSTGPYHASENPEGRGDSVLGMVTVDPWYPDTLLDLSDVRAPLPDHFELSAYPNPFNSSVTLTLLPPEAMIVRVELFDVLGRRVQELWNGPLAFEKRITFDGSHLSSGIYFARVWQPIGNRQLALTKLVLMK